MTTQTTTATDTSNPQMKVCTVCEGEPQPIENFYVDATSAGGRRGECKACHIKKAVSRRAKAAVGSAARMFTDALEGRWRDAFLAIAGQRCSGCDGHMAVVKVGGGQLCKCVYAKIFDDIMTAYEQSRASGGCRGEITEHHVPGFGGGVSYSRKNQEFVADVAIVVKRVARRLDESPDFRGSFPYHEALAKHVILDGLRLVDALYALRLGGQFERRARLALDRVAMRAAIEAVEMQPYALFPLSKYFEEATVVNTVANHPEIRRQFNAALRRDTNAKVSTAYGLH